MFNSILHRNYAYTSIGLYLIGTIFGILGTIQFCKLYEVSTAHICYIESLFGLTMVGLALSSAFIGRKNWMHPLAGVVVPIIALSIIVPLIETQTVNMEYNPHFIIPCAIIFAFSIAGLIYVNHSMALDRDFL